ncbi:hypothetical protein JJB07_03855 [Tumebacillus sp. ITR2]|uniref:Uncharacterized protein n=1 Tax=Tumebacillus amylolyticus TaxID=2801339 RepID=A0ABS1J6H3_9BACL|nr:CBO0543 family protein [Tumebacillus amylolyticus]MBL0385775.1 hypothetical protein [Tumebacillus amylolyticus]
MSVEFMVLSLSWIMLPLLWMMVPKQKIHHALIAALFCQMLGWAIDLTVVQMRWVEYPVREFPHATRFNFSLFTLFYPTLIMLFVLYAPRSPRRQAGHFLLCALGLTLFAELLRTYTNLSAYRHWAWYCSFLTFSLKIYATFWFTRWFQKGLVS